MQSFQIKTNKEMSRFEDAKSIMSSCHYLMMKAQLIGNLCFDGHSPTKEENQISEKCREMCDKITRILEVCKINDIPPLIDYYDLAYRIGRKCPPDNNVIKDYRHRVFKAWKSGDRRIEESSVFGIISPEVSYHLGRADKEYIQAYLSIKDRWISTLRKFDCFPEVTAYENYQRLALMMREKLDKEFENNSRKVKRKWYERNKIDDISSVSSTLLSSYRRFLSSLFPIVLDYNTQLELDNRILSELSTRSDINPYDREAFQMALQFNKEVIQP